MYILIGDIGNTVTKLCLVDVRTYKLNNIVYLSSKGILNKKILKNTFKKIFSKKNIIHSALVSSVVPLYENKIKIYLEKNFKINLSEINNKSIKKTIKISVKNKKQVGSDRVANAIGVYKKYKLNSIVVDFGTATTFDVVTSDGVYKGGIIAPGINISIKSSLALTPQWITSLSLLQVCLSSGVSMPKNLIFSPFKWIVSPSIILISIDLTSI